MTGFRHHLRNGVASLAIAAALWQQPASAETWEVVVPPNMPRSAELKAELWDFFLRGMAPGDALTLHDGLFPRELARVEIPDDPRFDAQRARTKGLARETATLARRIDGLGVGDSGEFRYRIAFPEFAFAYANSRTGGESHMLVITSGMHNAPLEPDFSLRHRGGELVLPADSHIEAPLSESPYGTQGREDALRGVVAHFCLMTEDIPMTTHQKDELRRFWSLYVTRLGGELATFTESLPGCFDRWRGKMRDGLPEEVLNISSDVIVMRNVTRASVAEGSPSDRRPRTRGAATGDGGAAGGEATAEGPDDFTLFTSHPHPALDGVDVTTGVTYRPEEYPRTYVNAWCYAMVDHAGATVRIHIGQKVPLKEVEWTPATDGTLAAAGISGAEADAAKAACDFPADAT